MNSFLSLLFTGYTVVSIFSGCSSTDNGVMCTLEFRTITLTINGAEPDEYFTLRIKTNDTIRIGRDNITGSNVYPVLDDSFQKMLEGKTEEFRFMAYRNNVLLVNEPFLISADKCHISLVSGKTEINL